MPSCSYLTINLDRIASEIASIRGGGHEVMPMIKGNAYGTDPLTLARFFETLSLPIVGVSHTSEGAQLREGGIEMPIFLLSAPPFEAKTIAHYNLQPAISSLEEIEALDAAAASHSPLQVHLNINTGMNRFGVAPEKALSLFQAIEKSRNLELIGIMSHLAASDDQSLHPFSQRQISLFRATLETLPRLPKWIHIACSGSLGQFDLSFCNLARIGRAIFEPALKLETRIVSITCAKQGETVGYGRIHTIEQSEATIAVLPIGYYDGYPRYLPSGGYVLIHGEKAPIMGRVCMDFMMVDVTNIRAARVGDLATLMGPELPPSAVASWAGANVREIFSHMSQRIERRYISHDPERLRHALRSLEKDPVAR